MGLWEWIGVGAGAAFLLAIFIITIAARRNKTRAKNNLVETKKARFTFDTATTTVEGEAKMSFTRDDIMVPMGTTLQVGPKADIKPGKYIVLCTEDNTPKFNLRVGSYVKEYKHNQEVVLADGSEFTAISASVILR